MEIPSFLLKLRKLYTWYYDKKKERIRMQAINATKAVLPPVKAAPPTKTEPLNKYLAVSDLLKEEAKPEILK